MSRGPKKKKARHCRYYRELSSNGYNTVVDYGSLKDVEDAIADALDGPDGQIGYLVIDGFSVDPDIVHRLGISNDFALLISKGKIKNIAQKHELTANEIVNAFRKAAIDPYAIAVDSLRHSFQFSVETGRCGYRVIFEFNAIPRGIQNVRAHVLTSVFREDRCQARAKRIREGHIEGLLLIYEKGEGWAALATSSPNRRFCAVASAVREDLFSSADNILDKPIDVKRSKER